MRSEQKMIRTTSAEWHSVMARDYGLLTAIVTRRKSFTN